MNLHQVIAQRVGTRDIKFSESTGIAKPFQIMRIHLALRVFGQQTELLDIADGNQLTAPASKSAHIQRPDVAWKVIKSLMFPDQFLCPIGHVLVTEWTGTHSVKYCGSLFATDLKIDFERRAVAIALYVT